MKTVWLLVLLALACSACRSSVGVGARGHLQLEIEGNETFDDDALHDVIAEELGDALQHGSSKATVDDAAFSLELYHREQGFPACTVEYRIEDERASALRATLTVVEGPRVRITATRIVGNRSIRAPELLPFVQPEAELLAQSDDNWFSLRRVRDGLSAIRSYYRGQGFLDARVSLVAPRSETEPWKPEVDLEIAVEEGPRWILRAISLAGGLNEVDRRLVQGEFLGHPLTPRTAGTVRGLMREIYGRAGYPEAEVEADTEEGERLGDARLHVRIVPGPLVRITGIDVVGNERTRRERLVKALQLHAGDRYDLDKERESQRDLYRLGVFSSVGLTLVGQGEERRLRVEVVEREARELYLEPGFGSYEGPRLGFGWHELNLAGTARRLELDASVSELALHAALSLTDPRFLDRDLVANLALFGDRREEPSFRTTSLGGRLGFTREINEHFDLRTVYELSTSKLDSSDVDAAAITGQNDVDISSLSFSPRWHTLDSAPLPTQGILLRPILEWGDAALGSELEFLRLRWNLAWYTRLGARDVLALSWRGGVVAPYGSSASIPLQERFFNGGESSVRSFGEDQLGPKDSQGDPSGGEAFDVFTLEVRHEFIGHIEGALFADAGNLLEDHTDFLRFDDLRFALGIGLRYLLPVGPLRFDVGFNPNPRAEEANYAAHFSVGFSF